MKQIILLLIVIINSSLFAADTELQLYRPFTETTKQAPLKIVQQKIGECIQQSKLIVREDAWRCVTESDTYDPCFVKPYGDKKTAELINIIKDNDITIEVCLTSNLQTLPELEMKAENHSLIKMLEAGINISPSTDNRTVSNTTVSEELFKIQSAFKLDKDTVLSLIKNGFKARFHE